MGFIHKPHNQIQAAQESTSTTVPSPTFLTLGISKILSYRKSTPICFINPSLKSEGE